MTSFDLSTANEKHDKCSAIKFWFLTIENTECALFIFTNFIVYSFPLRGAINIVVPNEGHGPTT